MAEQLTAINPEMLIWARGATGTTLAEAQAKFGEDKIGAWEKGEAHPTYSELKKIGDYYRKPIAVFFFPEPPKYENIPASCRTLPIDAEHIFNRQITKAVDWTRAMQLNLYELFDQTNPADQRLADLTFDLSDIKVTAAQLRDVLGADLVAQKNLKTRSDAFEFWRGYFYKLGIFVFKQAFKDDSVSGFCIYDNEFPVICVNNSIAHARQIFTLFHEIYHLIHETSGVDILKKNTPIDRQIDSNVEWMCNRFAGAFLVPDNDFLGVSWNSDVNDEAIQKWSDKYSVSREVILYKLFDLNRISYDSLQQKREEFKQDYFRKAEFDADGKKKGGGNYYANQGAYLGSQYLTAAFSSYYSKKITVTQLSQYLGMKVHSARELASQKGWGAI